MDDYFNKSSYIQELKVVPKKDSSVDISVQYNFKKNKEIEFEYLEKSKNREVSINEAILKKFINVNDGKNQNFLKEIINIYLEATPDLIQDMKNAVQTKNKELFIRTAHNLKSSSANLGAMKLSRISENLEMMVRNNGFDNVLVKTEMIEIEFEKVKLALKRYL